MVHTSKLWGSGLDGSHASSHSVAHSLQENRTNQKHRSGLNLSSYSIPTDVFDTMFWSFVLYKFMNSRASLDSYLHDRGLQAFVLSFSNR